MAGPLKDSAGQERCWPLVRAMPSGSAEAGHKRNEALGMAAFVPRVVHRNAQLYTIRLSRQKRAIGSGACMRFRLEPIMPTAAVVDLVHVRVSGTIGIASQSWSTGFWIACGSGTFATQATLDTYATAVRGKVDTWVTSIKTYWSSTYVYNGVKCSHYDPGQLVPNFVSVPTVTAQQGTGSAILPSFTALVASLRTANPRRVGRGRMYVPINKDTEQTDGEASAAAALNYAQQTATMLTGVNTLVPGFGAGVSSCCVYSAVDGFTRAITRVVCDSKYDVQHRRTDKLGPSSIYSYAV